MSERIVTPEWIAIERSWCAIGVATPASMLHALDEVERLQAAVERVRALHVGEKRHVGWIDVTCCRECSDDDNTYAYPCPTLRALEVGRE